MPVEIKELIIRTNIVANQGRPSSREKKLTEKEKRELIESCVHQVVKIIERNKER